MHGWIISSNIGTLSSSLSSLLLFLLLSSLLLPEIIYELEDQEKCWLEAPCHEY